MATSPSEAAPSLRKDVTAVSTGPGRQPRRDRGPDHPRLPRAGHRGGRRLQRRGRRRRPRPHGRRRGPPRARAAHRELPADRRRRRRGDRVGCRGRPPGLRVPRGARGVRSRRRGRGPRLRRPVGGGDRCARRQAACAAARGAGRGAVGAGDAGAGARRSRGPGRVDRRDGARHRLPVAGQGGRRRRRTRDASRRARTKTCPPRSRPDPRRRCRPSATVRSTWSARSCRRVTSRSSCSPTRTVASSPWASGTARSSAVTRSSSRRRPRRGSANRNAGELHALAVRLGEAAGLRNAATCEFLLDPDGRFWFLEVNTRLQVEHGVTELVAGVDIVREQLWLAAGAPLSAEVLAAADRAATPSSHAIEVRIAAEDPARDFAPTPGRVGRWVMPSGPGVRVDTHIEAGTLVPPDYDNLIAKLMVHALGPRVGDRPDATRARRDRDRRRPDDAAVPSRSSRTASPSVTASCRRAGSRSTGMARRAAPTPRARRCSRPASRRSLRRPTSGVAEARVVEGDARDGHDGTGPDAGGWRAAGRESAVDRWPR